MSVFSRDAGTSTLGWRACNPLRMRVSMSAIGSVVVIPAPPPLPGRLDHAGDFAGQRELPETDPAQFELANEPARPSAAETTVAMPASELRLPIRCLGRCGRRGDSVISCDLCGGCHLSPTFSCAPCCAASKRGGASIES